VPFSRGLRPDQVHGRRMALGSRAGGQRPLCRTPRPAPPAGSFRRRPRV